jgi:hypothetical protein
MDLCHASILQGCTQLEALTLVTSDVKGVSTIAQLTGLTQLELHSDTQGFLGQQLFSDEEQAELGSALAALSNLQNLLISHAPPGPVTQALSQLSSLTKLTLSQQDLVHDPGPLVLPSCVRLTINNSNSIRHLSSIQAPKLQHLAGVSLALTPNDLDSLRWLCRGMLRACTYLNLALYAWSKEDTVALMAVVSQDWRPSTEALQPIRSTGIGHNRICTSSDPPQQWTLQLWDSHCSRQCLELVPKGLAELSLQ